MNNNILPSCRRCGSGELTDHRDYDKQTKYTESFTTCNDCDFLILNSTLYISITPENAAEVFDAMLRVIKEC